MQPVKMIFFALLAFAAVHGGNSQQPNQFGQPLHLSPTPTEDPSLASRFNYFDLELLKAFDDTQNYFMSPASIKATLGMVLEGARGRCAEEISKAIRIPLDQSAARTKLQSLLYDLNEKSSSTTVESANGVFISDKFKIVPKYAKNVHEHYGAEISSVNFANTGGASRLINGWVSNSTHGLIPEIVTPEIFNAEATLVIANALYFKGQWKYPFDEKSTNIRCFYSRKNTCTNAKTMQTVDNFYYKYISDIDAQAIQLPYGDGKYAMLVLLPSEKQTAEGLIRDLQHATFADIVNRLEPTEVLVNLPKFEIDYTGDIVPVLEHLGVHEIFNENANLSGIVEGGQIKVNNIVHKAKVEVNEKGTIAAAATGVVVIPLMGSSMPRFVADHPFLFFIYHVKSNNILFEGRVNSVADVYQEIFPRPQNAPAPRPFPQSVPVNQPHNQQNGRQAAVGLSLQGHHTRPLYYPSEAEANAYNPQLGNSRN